MSDDLDKKIQQIAQILGQDNVPDNVKELISLLAASLGKKEENNARPVPPDAGKEEKPDIENMPVSENTPVSEEPAVNKDALNSAKRVLDRFNAASDPRINLLQAIKPFMNNRRQKKIGNCIQLLQIAGLSRMLSEHEK